MREIIIRNIDNAPNGKEFFAGISGNFKDFGQTLCELIDNPISNFRAHGIRGRVEIVLEEQGDYVEVSVRDNGTGIENMDAALTIAARSCAESTLNEHGMGLKHALASINAGEDQHWSIQTRTAEDVANDRYQRAEGPYDIHMPVSMIPGSGEVAGGTGTVVRVRCPMHKFLTLKPASKKEEPTFGQMLVRLLAEKKSAEPGVLRVSTEKNLYQCLNLQIKSDLFVSTTEGVTLFEAKAGGSKAEDLYQLRMYHDGCVADDMEVREAVLIAQRHPDTVKALLAELNRQKDKKGRPYHFALTTWDEEGIALPPDAA